MRTSNSVMAVEKRLINGKLQNVYILVPIWRKRTYLFYSLLLGITLATVVIL